MRITAMRIPVVLAVALLPLQAAAQDGLRSASLPEQRVASPGTERDLYTVPPDFYSRRPARDGNRLFFPQIILPPYAPFYGPVPPWDVPGHPSARPAPPARAEVEYAEARRSAPTAALPPVVPGKPKTIYVIPGCYAGDRPPRAEWLPRGCSRSDLRIIPPS